MNLDGGQLSILICLFTFATVVLACQVVVTIDKYHRLSDSTVFKILFWFGCFWFTGMTWVLLSFYVPDFGFWPACVGSWTC